MDNFTYESKYGTYKECFWRVNKYADGNHRLDIYSQTEGPIATVTTTTGDKIPDDMIAVKNYSENEGMLDWLFKNDIVDEHIAYFIGTEYVVIPVCKLTEKGLAIVADN